MLVESGPVYSGFSFTRESVGFALPLNSGNSSTIGGRIKLPFSSTGVFVDNGPVYSGFSFTGASNGFTPPLNSGNSLTTGGFSGLLSETIFSVTFSVIFPFSGFTS